MKVVGFYARMVKLLKYLGLFVLIAFGASSVYYLYALHQARTYTLEVIAQDLKKAQWRSPNGIVRQFEILGRGLSERQKEILVLVQDLGFHQHKGIDLWTPGAGLTTITQAIVKKLYFGDALNKADPR